jgi:Arf-GAP/SH3 domain/ANK repeat/PH domain-containing protein
MANINGGLPRAPSSTDGDIPRRKSSITPIFQSTVSPPPLPQSAGNPFVTSPQSPEANKAILATIAPQADKFKGIRDLEERSCVSDLMPGAHRKEGLLWALSRPGSHVDPKGLNKQAWHK